MTCALTEVGPGVHRYGRGPAEYLCVSTHSTHVKLVTCRSRGISRYVAQDLEYDRYSDHTNELLRECERKSSAAASAKKASEIARKLLDRGRPVEEIVEDSGLTTEEIEALRASSN